MKMQRIVVSSVLSALFILSPALQAQQPTQPEGLTAQFQQIEDEWSTALAHQDQFTLETILAPDYVYIASDGDIATRNERVADMFEKSMPSVVAITQKVADVRVIEDVAIVDGTYMETTKLNGEEQREQGVFTHIYQRTRNVWKCVQSQRTAVPQAAPEGKKSKKKSRL